MRKIFSLLSRLLAVQRSVERAKKRGKPWYASKTVWVNLIALMAVLASFKGIEITPEEQAQILTGVLAIVNILLRFTTHEPIVFKKIPEEVDGEVEG